VQGVEGVEELLHGLLLVAEELDVVEQQDVALLAVTGPELRHPVLLEGVDQVVRERLRGQVHHVAVRVLPQCVVSHGVHEVRLAQAHAAVEEQRVVGLPGEFATAVQAATANWFEGRRRTSRRCT